jgi:hypothetical protein
MEKAERSSTASVGASRRLLVHAAWAGPALFGVAVVAGASLAPAPVGAPLVAQTSAKRLPPPPANGEMGFVVENFSQSFLEDKEACPDGPQPIVREAFLQALPEAERKRLSDKANQAELDQRWRASVLGPDGTNICSQPEMFDRPMLRTVQSKRAVGLDLDGDGKAQSCDHQEFVSPQGERGVDNQAYRALGCKLHWRGPDGTGGDTVRGGTRSQFASGEWTQVLLLRGVDSLENDPDVEVVYANTPDRPVVDSEGKYLPRASFTVSDKAPRYRNVLKGRIVGGVLTTEPGDVKLTQTWGQGGARDIRGNRTKFDLRSARLKLTFQPDGSLRGLVGGYQPVFDLIQSPTLGATGSAEAGIDCAGELKTLKAHADGIRDPKTGQCTGVSNAYQMTAVPAFVNDIPDQRTAAK